MISSTNADSSSGDDSGKVYDFKDSRTSGVVTVTKSWDDSSSNDERTVPDVSISTIEPSKLNRTYTITFHGNGMKFADGNEENTVVYNGSGQIISGTYKEPPSGFGAWYFDANYQNKAILNTNGTLTTKFVGNVNTESINLYAKPKTFVLKSGPDFYKLIPSTATSVVFTDEIMPSSKKIINVDADGDGGVVAWMDGTVMKVSTQIESKKVIANTDCSKMFFDKNKLTSIDLNYLDTSKATDMSCMFWDCFGLPQLNLTSLNTSNVRNMEEMFYNCNTLATLDLTSFDTSKVTDMNYMFSDCTDLKSINISSFNTSNVVNMSYMFSYNWGFTSLDLSNLNTQNVTNMQGMFNSCSKLSTLDLSPLNTSKVTNMSYMFKGCEGLTSLDLSPLDTSNVTDMRDMFSSCSGLTALDLSSLNTSKVTTMEEMFYYCTKLTFVDLSSWDTSSVSNMESMFYMCRELNQLKTGSKLKFVGNEYLTGTWINSNGEEFTTIPNNKADTYTRR